MFSHLLVFRFAFR